MGKLFEDSAGQIHTAHKAHKTGCRRGRGQFTPDDHRCVSDPPTGAGDVFSRREEGEKFEGRVK